MPLIKLFLTFCYLNIPELTNQLNNCAAIIAPTIGPITGIHA